MTLSEIIKKYREEHHLSQRAFAQMCGVSHGYIHIIEKQFDPSNKKKPQPQLRNVKKLAQGMGITPEYLVAVADDLGLELVEREPAINDTFIRFPIIGNIAAGFDNEAVMEYSGEYAYFSPQDVHVKADDYFCLRIKGDSMYPRLLNGDIVLVHKQSSVDSGDIAVVMYDGMDATVKKVNYVYGEDWLELVPFNPEYQIKRIENADLELCRVLGKVVKLQRDV